MSDDDGLYQKFNAAGKMVYQADYVMGKLEGREIEYYDDGKIKSCGVWKDGRLTTGCETRFDENGKQTAPGPKGCAIPKWEYER
ncbi:toxin-antitoxin system YwqK family antitoxin [Pectobacterium jejuense]|uniref:toxin-antitoxin system YwqK family antitoxin n=1 Tax=Pectobacterium jejuense TaxID=2974022 RepID=UPI0022810342|nr:hypothetical protein [Pectobacterium jejuense]MCY9848545.1 hypothetical protein [Pectobacterium jejuense]